MGVSYVTLLWDNMGDLVDAVVFADGSSKVRIL